METLEERIKRVVQEDVAISQYNPDWPQLFEQEKKHLLSCLPLPHQNPPQRKLAPKAACCVKPSHRDLNTRKVERI